MLHARGRGGIRPNAEVGRPAAGGRLDASGTRGACRAGRSQLDAAVQLHDHGAGSGLLVLRPVERWRFELGAVTLGFPERLLARGLPGVQRDII